MFAMVSNVFGRVASSWRSRADPGNRSNATSSALRPWFAYEDESALLFNDLPSQVLHLGHVLQWNIVGTVEGPRLATRADGMGPRALTEDHG